ncbi:MAG TPA: hypothetical protein PLD46_05900 [Hyphomicrobium sp.]|nr:hypothetical protein [Hyphomicrobium sp.]
MSTLSTATISLALAAGLAGALAEMPGSFPTRQGPEFPLVALAWAQSKCDSALTARPDTPRVHYDDYMRVSADYDERLARDGLSAACERAERIARTVAQTN